MKGQGEGKGESEEREREKHRERVDPQGEVTQWLPGPPLPHCPPLTVEEAGRLSPREGWAPKCENWRLLTEVHFWMETIWHWAGRLSALLLTCCVLVASAHVHANEDV